ncbi:hypothetical protein EJ110_NYTH03808 [Nymphaea thermarum]|nr:hypothetical protein EJ110_NYTH03808 [Nymphaea thermarum]
MKQAVKCGHHVAFAHADYLRHIRLTGSALSHISAGESVAVSDATSPRLPQSFPLILCRCSSSSFGPSPSREIQILPPYYHFCR